MIVVINRRNQKGGFYVGRPTILGNPYELGIDGERAEVIGKYRLWLAKTLMHDSPQRQTLEHLAELLNGGMMLALSCWCAPHACHADVIKEVVVSRAEGNGWETICSQLLAVPCA
jgi:hypothetical protein